MRTLGKLIVAGSIVFVLLQLVRPGPSAVGAAP